VRKFAFLIAAALTSVFTVIPAVAGSPVDPLLLSSEARPAAAGSVPDGGGANAQPAGDGAVPAAAVNDNSTSPASGRILGSKLGVGVKLSPLGIGIEAATPVTYHTNVRVGFNVFGYSRDFTVDGITYDANLSFRSLETHFDWFPFSNGFHLSPGLMAYNGNRIKANAAVPGGQQFTLGGITYMSDAADPVSGTGRVDFGSVAPTLLVGWGNLVPRSSKHISVPVEIGAAFQSPPKATLNLVGTACDPTGVVCQNVVDNQPFQNNVVAQQNKLNNNLSFLRVYPIISVGFGYKF
jgi:hypothetical protein